MAPKLCAKRVWVAPGKGLVRKAHLPNATKALVGGRFDNRQLSRIQRDATVDRVANMNRVNHGYLCSAQLLRFGVDI